MAPRPARGESPQGGGVRAEGVVADGLLRLAVAEQVDGKEPVGVREQGAERLRHLLHRKGLAETLAPDPPPLRQRHPGDEPDPEAGDGAPLVRGSDQAASARRSVMVWARSARRR